ncbi:thioredoxin [Alicyclobacillus cellulosilyticus]|uniref:Thioredoxin n=1 Tax=Alicyclobacillus cellulosilyticus TaxID=1003997 RepID=A0A917K808_9BACL|nr:thioredoxin domain-containing protein [Alicyclobacillus cellulosilyticus]GGJ02200.1 thioredoxin [Alicyclobacillus cellulosilyticus]
MSHTRTLFLATLGAAIALFTAIVTWDVLHQRGIRMQQSLAAKNLSVADHPRLGSAGAPVTILEFADFKCTSCKYWQTHVLPVLWRDAIRPGKAKLYFFAFPIINKDSFTAAEAAYSVYRQRPAAFWTFADALYRHQQAEAAIWATPSFLARLIAADVPGVDARQVLRDLADGRERTSVERDLAAGERLGVNATPSVFVNGQPVPDPLDASQIESMIKAAMR